MPEEKKTLARKITEIVKEAKVQQKLPALIENLRKEVEKAKMTKEEVRAAFNEIPKERIEECKEKAKEINLEPTVDNIVALYMQGSEREKPYGKHSNKFLSRLYKARELGKSLSMEKMIEQFEKVQPKETDFLSILIDTGYINSIVINSQEGKGKEALNDPGIIRIFSALHEEFKRRTGGKFEIVVTQAVYDELNDQMNEKDDKGAYKFTSKALSELDELIYGKKMIKLVKEYGINEETKQELSRLMRKKSMDKNACVGDGDTAILAYVRDMFVYGEYGHNMKFNILTPDTDFQSLVGKCKNIEIISPNMSY